MSLFFPADEEQFESYNLLQCCSEREWYTVYIYVETFTANIASVTRLATNNIFKKANAWFYFMELHQLHQRKKAVSAT